MDKVVNYSALQEVTAVALNTIQDRAQDHRNMNGWCRGGTVRSSDGVNLVVSPIRVQFISGSDVNAYAATASETTVATSSLTASTWYYLYVYISAGALAFEYSTTAPTDIGGEVRKGSDSTRRYLGSFYSNSVSAVNPFRMTRHGRLLYRASAVARATYMRALNGGTFGTIPTFTDVSLATWLPPHARIAILEVNLDNVVSATGADLRTKGDTTDSQHFTSVSATANTLYPLIEIETDTSRVIQAQVSVTGPAVTLYAVGYQDPWIV
jgi:hypothetical protein